MNGAVGGGYGINLVNVKNGMNVSIKGEHACIVSASTNLQRSSIILPAPNETRGDFKYCKVAMQIEPTCVRTRDGVVEWQTKWELQN